MTDETPGHEWIHRFTEQESARILAHELDPAFDPGRGTANDPGRGTERGTYATGDRALAGIRFAVKDNIDVAGIPTTAAFPPRAARAATRSAAAVARLIRAGAVPAGKTNLDQFATGLVGTRSPFGACHAVGHPDHVSGGSSSGSAIAVASGQVELALGTDTAGSGRVPAAFNGVVGFKPSRGLISTSGVLPACRSLDCVSIFARSVPLARDAFDVLAAFDPSDPYARPRPDHSPRRAAVPRVIAVPRGGLELEAGHREAWETALDHARSTAEYLVEIDLEPFLAAARLLYQGPWLAERWNAIAPLLGAPALEHVDLDPAVRRVLTGAGAISGAATFAGFDELARLRRLTEAVWERADALLLPTAPCHPTLADVAADPIGVNTRLGTYTNFVNLLDLCAIAVPAGTRPDGLPFGVQLIAPAFADDRLLDLAAAWTGEAAIEQLRPRPGRGHLAVVGAHMSGLPLNARLLELGADLVRRTKTAPRYRLHHLPGTLPARPGLFPVADGQKGAEILAEVWELPHQAVGALLETIPPPLGLGRVALADGTGVPGFLAFGPVPADAVDVTEFGGWRAYVAEL